MGSSESLLRNHWLGTVKDITDATQKRARLMSSLDEEDWMLNENERDETKQKIEQFTEDIRKSLQEMKAVETERPLFGLTALLEGEPSQHVRHLLVLMIARALGQGASKQYMTVETYSEEISVGNFAIALEIRSAFRSDSDIRPHITFKPGETLEQSSNPRLSERSLNVVLGLSRDIQSEVICEWFRGAFR